MVTLDDFSRRELAIAMNLISDRATDIQQQIDATAKFFTNAGAEIPDQSWRSEQVDVLSRVVAILHHQMVDVSYKEIVKSN